MQEYDDGATSPSVEYVRGSDYGGGIGGILYTLRGTDESYNHYNLRGDVVAKVSYSGYVSYQAAYEAFGRHGDTSSSEEYGENPDRQQANTKDEDPTGLLNEGFRYRDLKTGTFITRDPLGMVDGPNVYTYVNQNPWSKFDPLGLREESKEEQKNVEQLNDLVNESIAQMKNAYEGSAVKKELSEFSDNLSKSISDYRGMIANVPNGQKDPDQLMMMNEALRKWSSPDESAKYTYEGGEYRGNKCNRFVCDVVQEGTGQEMKVERYPWIMRSPPSANEFGDPSANIPGTQAIWSETSHYSKPATVSNAGIPDPVQPEMGNIVSFPSHNGSSGHTGISMGNNVYISATDAASPGNQNSGIRIKSEKVYGSLKVYRRITE